MRTSNKLLCTVAAFGLMLTSQAASAIPANYNCMMNPSSCGTPPPPTPPKICTDTSACPELVYDVSGTTRVVNTSKLCDYLKSKGKTYCGIDGIGTNNCTPASDILCPKTCLVNPTPGPYGAAGVPSMGGVSAFSTAFSAVAGKKCGDMECSKNFTPDKGKSSKGEDCAKDNTDTQDCKGTCVIKFPDDQLFKDLKGKKVTRAQCGTLRKSCNDYLI